MLLFYNAALGLEKGVGLFFGCEHTCILSWVSALVGLQSSVLDGFFLSTVIFDDTTSLRQCFVDVEIARPKVLFVNEAIFIAYDFWRCTIRFNSNKRPDEPTQYPSDTI